MKGQWLTAAFYVFKKAQCGTLKMCLSHFVFQTKMSAEGLGNDHKEKGFVLILLQLTQPSPLNKKKVGNTLLAAFAESQICGNHISVSFLSSN